MRHDTEHLISVSDEGGTRTHTNRILSPVPLPLDYSVACENDWDRTSNDEILSLVPLPNWATFSDSSDWGGTRTHNR